MANGNGQPRRISFQGLSIHGHAGTLFHQMECRSKGSPEGHASVGLKLATLGPPGGFLLVEAVGRQGDRLQIISCTTEM